MKRTEPEKDFQTEANEHGKSAAERIREEIEALEHAQDCQGRMECEACSGTGYEVNAAGDHEDCPTCKGEGDLPCTAGKDSDNPDDWHDEDAAQRTIDEGPLSVEVVRQYVILLGTGGPAARITGNLGEDGQPESAHYEFQDWWKPWTRADLTNEEEDVLLRYAQRFYFEELN